LEETATSIYFPSPFIFEEFNEDYSPAIYITGEASDVARVKDMLTKLAAQKVYITVEKIITKKKKKKKTNMPKRLSPCIIKMLFCTLEN